VSQALRVARDARRNIPPTSAAFEAQFRCMSHAEDGVADALFDFTWPVSTANFWCPPSRRPDRPAGP
jgi:deferrochelatase/peroxidase EfeB